MHASNRVAAVTAVVTLLLAGCGSSAQEVTLTDVPDNPMKLASACEDLFGEPADLAGDLGFEGEVVWEGEYGGYGPIEGHPEDLKGLYKCQVAIVGSDNEDLIELYASDPGTTDDQRAETGVDGLLVYGDFDPDFADTPSQDQREALQDVLDDAAGAVKL